MSPPNVVELHPPLPQDTEAIASLAADAALMARTDREMLLEMYRGETPWQRQNDLWHKQEHATLRKLADRTFWARVMLRATLPMWVIAIALLGGGIGEFLYRHLHP